jgi:hypothetical protein
LGAIVSRTMRKNIYSMILTFIIISVTIVTAALVQLEQFKTSLIMLLHLYNQKRM